ncbi:MAG: ABC transporter ATP-binding protein [Chloroflexi bacterium]|nr:ABC transporter ATP-binding protein [Chloroflexota bacterium]
MPLLTLDSVVAGYGQIMAIKGINLEVDEGDIVALIGSNGAGKSTTINTISGLIRPRSGTITFDGVDIVRVPPHKIVDAGISQVPEGRGIFGRLTVLENLEMGAYRRGGNVDLEEDLDKVYTLFPRLKERLKQAGGSLSGGEQQMLAIGRGLMARPRLMLLDEPSMGLSPILTEVIFQTIVDINRQGTTLLLVEQNAQLALAIANRASVLESGEIVLQGSAAELREDPQVRAVYLGEG